MIESILQGLSVAGPLLLGVGGMLINKWVSTYRDDKHFYSTRFLDKDGNPDSDEAGYIKDDAGKLCPVIVKKYSFGKCKKDRYVEGMEVTEDGKHGLPFKMSLAAFRTKQIRGPKKQLTANEEYLLNKNGITFPEIIAGEVATCKDPIEIRMELLENAQREQSLIILRDLKDIFVGQNKLLDLGQRLSKWESKRPVELGRLKKRVSTLEHQAGLHQATSRCNQS